MKIVVEEQRKLPQKFDHDMVEFLGFTFWEGIFVKKFSFVNKIKIREPVSFQLKKCTYLGLGL